MAGLLLGVIAAFGGFQRATTDGETQLAIGATIDIGNWEVTVVRATLSNTYPDGASMWKPVVRVWVDLTNKGTVGSYGPSSSAVAYLGPHGYLDDESPAAYLSEQGPSTIGPGLSRRTYSEFPIEDGEQWAHGDVIKVIFAYQSYTDGGFTHVEQYEGTHVVGVDRLPVEDERR